MLRALGLLILTGIVTAGAIGVWLWQDMQDFRATALNTDKSEAVLNVPSGSNLRQLEQQLVANGWVDRPGYLYWLGRLTERAHLIKAGEYSIPAGTTPDQLLALLVKGRTVQHQMTLIEGWNFREVMAAVHDSELLTKTLQSTDAKTVMRALGREGEHPEGRFLPDTYSFPRGTTDVEFLQRAYQAMQKALEETWQGRDKNVPLKSPYEALILASIIEKETGIAGERSEIAGVFVRRLNKKMLLQTDPTVIYGIGPSFDGDIRRRDLRKDTPYNTYTRAGLPPTPIAMPGEAALYASVHPADGTSLYFVADGSGGHTFSNTLKQHNAAVRKYQLKK